MPKGSDSRLGQRRVRPAQSIHEVNKSQVTLTFAMEAKLLLRIVRIIQVLFVVAGVSARGRDKQGHNEVKLAAECGLKRSDVVFVLDESTSIWGPHFQQQLAFVNNLIDNFDTEIDVTHVGIITFSDEARPQLPLDGIYDKEETKQYISGIRKQGGGTRTDRALYEMRTAMFAPWVARPGIPHVAIVITDGASEQPSATRREARLAHEAGIHVIAIGIGTQIVQSELLAIASSEDDVLEIDSYAELEFIEEFMAKKTCEVTTKLPSTSTTTSSTTPSSTMPQYISGCHGGVPMDVYVGLPDDTGIVDADYSMQFVNMLVTELNLSPTQFRVGVLPRNCVNNKGINIADYDTAESFRRAMKNIELNGTHVHSQLKQLTGLTKTFVRQGAFTAGILVVDDWPLEDVHDMVVVARRQGIHLIVVGVGSRASRGDVQHIAASPRDFFPVESFEMLEKVVEKVQARICLVSISLR